LAILTYAWVRRRREEAVIGVRSIDVDHFQVRLEARTLTGRQFDVGRMLRVRIAAEFRLEGIKLPAVPETAEHAGTG
jgi:moderate conductance mechanosensitive channel